MVLFEGDNNPVSMAEVEARAQAGGAVVTAYTDSSGHFQLSGILGARYEVHVEAAGCAPIDQVVQGFAGTANVTLYLKRTVTRNGGPNGTVSARELSVPPKARRAFDKGMERLAKNDAASSVHHFKEAAAKFPDYYEAYYQIGVASIQLNRKGEAQEALQKSIDVSGGHFAKPHFALGAILCEEQKFADAERVIRRGIDVDASSWQAHFFLGEALLGMNRFDEAEKSAKEALLRKPDLAVAYIVLAYVHMRNGDREALLKDLNAYLRLAPDGPLSKKVTALRTKTERALAESARVQAPPRLVY